MPGVRLWQPPVGSIDVDELYDGRTHGKGAHDEFAEPLGCGGVLREGNVFGHRCGRCLGLALLGCQQVGEGIMCFARAAAMLLFMM